MITMSNFYYITIATKPHQVLNNIIKKIQSNNEQIHVLGMQENRNIGWQAKGNFGVKLKEVYDFVFQSEIKNNDIILFTDAYDVFYADDLETITERYLGFDCKVLFSAELYCWPDANIENQFPESPTKYRFLNSGTFIGRVGELKRMLSTNWITNAADDQLYYQ